MSEYKTTPELRCGWCGQPFERQLELDAHGEVCDVMLEEQHKEMEKEERRRMENQLWEEEHAAGRI